MTKAMLSTTCHCGAVRITVPRRPAYLLNCNCSICRRLGCLWAYYPEAEVQIDTPPEGQDAYIWGDKTLRTLRCKTCGCVTHWASLQPNEDGRMGINMRNFEPEQIGDVRIRRFDGAVSWTYLDEPVTAEQGA